MSLPAPSALTPTQRYFVAGTRVIAWVPTIASKASPSLSELNAGTVLSSEYMTVTGFELPGSNFAVPDAGSRVTSNIPGRIALPDSSINFYGSLTANDARTLFTTNLNGFIVIFSEGIVSGGKMDVWPVRVNTTSKPQDIEAAGMITVNFSTTSMPVSDVAIPTS